MTTFTPSFQMLPLHAIVPSPTNPRKNFDQAALDELAESIKATGVHTPVLVRPLPAHRLEDTAHLSPRPTHELIAGERRYRASVLAKADTIPAMIRELTDDQALEIQIIENLQRQDLSALEEAEGYQSLIDHSGVSAEDVARKIGKSRAYVYGRLKLLDAGQDVRDALRQGLIGREHAQLLARIPSTLLQAKALKEIIRTNHPEGVMSSRAAGEWIRKNYMLKIEQAPFDHTDATLSPRACTICPTRTGADQDIFADVMGADMCTDPSCYDNKVQQHHARRRAQLEAAGHQIIEGDDATELMPYPNSAPEGYARLDDVRDSPTDKPLREELAKLLDKGEVVPVMIVNPHKEGDVLACVPEDQVPGLLAKAGKKKASAIAQEEAEHQAKYQAEKHQKDLQHEYELAWRQRVVRTLHGNIEERGFAVEYLCHDLMHQLAKETLDSLSPNDLEQLANLLNVGEVAPTEGVRMWVDTCALGNASWSLPEALTLLLAQRDCKFFKGWEHQENEALLLAAKDQGVDIEAVKAEVQAEMTEREAQKAAEAQATADAAKALLPLAPAARASGVRGEAKGQVKTGKAEAKKRPAGASAQPAHLNAQEAMQGIAAALQGEEATDAARRSEAIPGAGAQGNEVGPASRPDGAAQNGQRWPFGLACKSGPGAQADAGGATPSPPHQAEAVGEGTGPQDEGLEASGSKAVKVGDRVRVIFDSPPFNGKLATVMAITREGKASVAVDGMASEYTFEVGEFEAVEGGAA